MYRCCEACRTPQGVRGLKCRWPDFAPGRARSHPAGGAWIEIDNKTAVHALILSHPAGGAWIEMYTIAQVTLTQAGRTPQGVRGLKFRLDGLGVYLYASHPAGGAWIEIFRS